MCPNCGGYKVEHKYWDINLILILLTLGLWIPVYLLWKWTIGFNSVSCQICGYEWKLKG